MSDEAWRTHERRWRQEPSDQDALGRAIAGMRRSGLVVPPDLLDARVEPATALETTLPLEVWAVLPGEREPTTVGWGPGRVEVPPHRYWGVGDVPAGLEGLGALGDELRSRGIPGLRVREFEPSRHGSDALPLIDRDALRALGPQPQLRWLELSHSWGQPTTPGGVVRALGCLALEVFRGACSSAPTRTLLESAWWVARTCTTSGSWSSPTGGSWSKICEPSPGCVSSTGCSWTTRSSA